MSLDKQTIREDEDALQILQMDSRNEKLRKKENPWKIICFIYFFVALTTMCLLAQNAQTQDMIRANNIKYLEQIQNITDKLTEIEHVLSALQDNIQLYSAHQCDQIRSMLHPGLTGSECVQEGSCYVEATKDAVEEKTSPGGGVAFRGGSQGVVDFHV